MAVVRKIVVAVEEDVTAPSYYTVSSYVTGDPGVTAGTNMYRRLSWTEAVDVMLVLFDENRPGQSNEPGLTNVKLW